MFTGIIEEIGHVVTFERRTDLELWDGSHGEGFVLVIRCSAVLDGAYIGCSIAVNGTCLTVTEFGADSFTANCAPETCVSLQAREIISLTHDLCSLRCTNLGDLRPGDGVNLERSMTAATRVSGHFVQGHVECTGVLVDKRREGESLWVTIELPSASAHLMRFIVHKGYIALDGTSLTVAHVDEARAQFQVMLIAHTQTRIVLPRKPIGARINVETDCLARHSEASTLPLRHHIDAHVARLESQSNTALALAAVSAFAAIGALALAWAVRRAPSRS